MWEQSLWLTQMQLGPKSIGHPSLWLLRASASHSCVLSSLQRPQCALMERSEAPSPVSLQAESRSGPTEEQRPSWVSAPLLREAESTWGVTLSRFSRVQLSATPWTVACQAPLSMGILQARILEWVAMPSSRGSSQPRDRTQVSCFVGRFFTVWATREATGVGSLSLFQGILPTQELNWGLSHCRQILHQLSYQRSPREPVFNLKYIPPQCLFVYASQPQDGQRWALARRGPGGSFIAPSSVLHLVFIWGIEGWGELG